MHLYYEWKHAASIIASHIIESSETRAWMHLRLVYIGHALS
jgi:hypothetical protein